MENVLNEKRIALLATNGFEDSELEKPLQALRSAGATVTIISEKVGSFEGKNGTKIEAEMAADEAVADDFDGLLLPGGVENPDRLRMSTDAVELVRAFFEQHKPVAAICHAPWLLIEAGVLDGRKVTSWPSLKTDLENAGAEWVDEEVVVDNGLVTSRKPDDLPAFCDKMIEEFAEGKHQKQTV
jgi:protease I